MILQRTTSIINKYINYLRRKYDIFFFFLADVYDEVCPDIEGKGLDCECVGGGRIEHDPVKKKLQIYGYSQASYRCVQLYLCRFITCNLQYIHVPF